jgi:hypothetical protein
MKKLLSVLFALSGLGIFAQTTTVDSVKPELIELAPIREKSIPISRPTIEIEKPAIPEFDPETWNILYKAYVTEQQTKYGQCGEWHDLALKVGWPAEEWHNLQKIIFRESRCTPDAWNGADAGLTQINQIHTKWLNQMGYSHPDDMFDPEKNLTFAYRLWSGSGWKPWRFSDPNRK